METRRGGVDGEVRWFDGQDRAAHGVSSRPLALPHLRANFPCARLNSKKSARTEGFKQQMKQHREELQQYETKLESTKQGLAKWAAHVGL